ncbi:MAG: helicase-related protein, partial [Candidatus Korarchaeota archaeon]|nr:helicase-related protein [Candidatus Korarchaeota archaeon]
MWEEVSGSKRALIGNAIRWFVRDGAAALRESVEKGKRLRDLIPDDVMAKIFSREVRPAHKLEALKRALSDHEGFEKAIVFVERIGIAELLHRNLSSLNPVLILGRRRIDPEEALRRAKQRESRILVSTSAGEEGIDLPEADLLVVWSNIASPLRFIQRLGRVLRAVTGQKWRPRWVIYLVTPDTVDVDSLLDGLMEARRAGVALNVDPEVVEYLWSLSRRRRYLELLEEPMPLDVLARASSAPEERVREALRWLGERGLVIYIHTPMGRVYSSKGSLDRLRERFGKFLKPDYELEGKATAILGEEAISARGRLERIYERLLRRLNRWGRFDRLRVSVRVREGGVERLVNLTYSFSIEDPQVLMLILDNAFCREVYG